MAYDETGGCEREKFGFSVENVRFLKPGDKSRCTYAYLAACLSCKAGGFCAFAQGPIVFAYYPAYSRWECPGFIREKAGTPGGV